MIPVVFVTVSEHIGHQMVINKIVGRNFFENPGLDKSIVVMVFQLCFANYDRRSLLGTTYGEI